jgi:hypothetical protein
MPMNNHLRSLWAKRGKGYSAHSASAAVVPPPPEGFRRAYYITTSDHALSNIIFRRLKVARFSELNDPFELLGMNLGGVRDRIRVQESKKKFDADNGLVCFSEDWLDPVLWSHYAAKHHGVALGFDLVKAFDVEYRKERDESLLPIGVGNKAEDTVVQSVLFTTKFESWKYEREWRILVPLRTAVSEGNLHFFAMGDNVLLREVILGSLCTLPFDRVRELVNTHHTNVVTIKSRMADKFFSIVPDENTVPPYPGP